MSTINKTTDTTLVNRAGVDHHITLDKMSTLQDTDLLLVNRAGVDYRCTAKDVKAAAGGGSHTAAAVQASFLDNGSGYNQFDYDWAHDCSKGLPKIVFFGGTYVVLNGKQYTPSTLKGSAGTSGKTPVTTPHGVIWLYYSSGKLSHTRHILESEFTGGSLSGTTGGNFSRTVSSASDQAILYAFYDEVKDLIVIVMTAGEVHSYNAQTFVNVKALNASANLQHFSAPDTANGRIYVFDSRNKRYEVNYVTGSGALPEVTVSKGVSFPFRLNENCGAQGELYTVSTNSFNTPTGLAGAAYRCAHINDEYLIYNQSVIWGSKDGVAYSVVGSVFNGSAFAPTRFYSAAKRGFNVVSAGSNFYAV